ncbi:hypothetical protein LTR97_004308 [Elasticomyces elasticus]|uniref:SET domain-containing protein n=1 Tax=Elasticomyces elasticus TaxID=574655 RepID=A0AAN7VTG2_9PEZI|nr:hypothetical protein LTR97_004308 [Elasticomyces elasticus]
MSPLDMDPYQKSLEDVDAALKRLNATLASYKMSSTTKPAVPDSSNTQRPVSTTAPKAKTTQKVKTTAKEIPVKPTPVPKRDAAPKTKVVPQANGNGNHHAAPMPSPALPPKPIQPSNGHVVPAIPSTVAPDNDRSHVESISEHPQARPGRLWQEVLQVRFCDRSSDETTLYGPGLAEMKKAGQEADLEDIERLLEDITSMHETFSHGIYDGYVIPSRIVLSQKYLQLGYPDLAAGEAYKALMLCDSVRDPADIYHGDVVSQLHKLIPQIPLVERIRQLKLDVEGEKAPPTSRAPGEDMDVEVDVWCRYHYLPWAYRLLSASLMFCACLKSACYYARMGMENLEKSMEGQRDSWLDDVITGCHSAVQQIQHPEYVVLPGDEKNFPELGMVRREVYPWNEWEPDRLEELPEINAMMAEVAPKLEVRATELPALAVYDDEDDDEIPMCTQLGVFAKEDIAPGEIILSETSVLTANNKLQDSLCDACNADLPALDSPAASEVRECDQCETVFCNTACLEKAEATYHRATCGNDLDVLLRDVPPEEAAESLYTLLLMRAIAMADVQDCHPLELDEVRYIWGDFIDEPWQDFVAPTFTHKSRIDPDEHDKAHGDIVRTLPWSFEHNVRLPIQILERMEIDPFGETNYDLWVCNTLFAKFRGTASARLSGQKGSGTRARGPEVSAVHPMWCLANHSCDPNVTWEWGTNIELKVRGEGVQWHGRGEEDGVRLKREGGIKKGEEILNHYCDIELPVRERREWASGALGGDCQCERCVWEERHEVGAGGEGSEEGSNDDDGSDEQ